MHAILLVVPISKSLTYHMSEAVKVDLSSILLAFAVVEFSFDRTSYLVNESQGVVSIEVVKTGLSAVPLDVVVTVKGVTGVCARTRVCVCVCAQKGV